MTITMRNETKLSLESKWIRSKTKTPHFVLLLKWLFTLVWFHFASPLKRIEVKRTYNDPNEENSLLPTFNSFAAQLVRNMHLYLQNPVEIPFLPYSFQPSHLLRAKVSFTRVVTHCLHSLFHNLRTIFQLSICSFQYTVDLCTREFRKRTVNPCVRNCKTDMTANKSMIVPCRPCSPTDYCSVTKSLWNESEILSGMVWEFAGLRAIISGNKNSEKLALSYFSVAL